MKSKQKRNVAINILLVILMQIVLNVLIPIKSIATEEIVTVQCKDVNFYNGLISKLGDKVQSKDDENKTISMTKTNIESVTEIVIVSLNGENKISDITGIEKFVNLRRFYLSGSDISDISPLAGLTNLEKLELRKSKINDISIIAGLTNLKELDLCSNNVSDINPLKGLTNLTSLNLWSNKITDISTISRLTNLTELDLRDNQINDISELSGLTNLTKLYLSNNQISDISKLSSLTNLTSLYLSDNNISDISELKSLINLEYLYLNNNQINNIDSIKDLRKLEFLYLSKNNIEDISVIGNFINLKKLRVGNNKINDISILSNLSNLENLGIEGNNITDLNVLVQISGLKKLVISSGTNFDGDGFYIGSNPLNKESFETIGQLKNLEELYLQDANISDLSFLKNLENLKDLNLKYNKIRDINVISGLTNLQKLTLGYNKINDISILENLTHLYWLQLSDNQISDISVISKLTKLTNVLDFWNQTIETTTSRSGTKEIELPQILKAAKDINSKVYTEKEYILTNCTLSSDGTKIIVDTDKVENASVKIDGGNADGSVLNITVTSDDTTPPIVEVKNSITAPTNQNVTVTITANEEIQEVSGWTLSAGKKILTKEYTENGEETVEVKDLVGNITTANVKVDNIDKVAPEVEVKYNVTAQNNENVTVTIMANEEIQEIEGWTLCSDKKTLTKTYTENKTETIVVKDLAGNITTAEVVVNNIEENKLKATVKYSTVEPTNQNVIVTITADKEMQEVEGWKLDASKKVMTKEYTENKEEEITIKDLVGNTTKANIKITNIDKIKPEVKVDYSNKKATDENVKVTIEANEEIRIPKGWIQDDVKNNIIYKEYDANTEETVTIVDLAGNETEVQIKIDNIIGNVTNNNGDDTISNIDIPKAGIRTGILIAIIFILICGIVTYKKYGKYKDIK